MSKIAEVLERLAALEAAVGIGHNGGPPLDDDEPPKRKPGLLPDKQVAQRYGVSVRSLERWDKISDLNFPRPIYIRRRRYRNIAKLDAWDRDNAGRVVSPLHRGDLAQALSRPRAQRGRFTKPRDIAQQ